jgi:hypothetical protein
MKVYQLTDRESVDYGARRGWRILVLVVGSRSEFREAQLPLVGVPIQSQRSL